MDVSEEDIENFKKKCNDVAEQTSSKIGKIVLVNNNINVIKMLLRNKRKYGLCFCPCKPKQFNEKNSEGDFVSVCPCKNFINELLSDGKCCCNLYIIK